MTGFDIFHDVNQPSEILIRSSGAGRMIENGLPGRTNTKACLQAVRLGSESTMSEAEPIKMLAEKTYSDARPSIKIRLQLL